MKLIRIKTAQTIQLEDGFFWSDENWSPIEQNTEYALNGALIVQVGQKKAGRPITLKPANNKKGWIRLRELNLLREWKDLTEQFTLQFEWPHDQRQFNVIFNHQEGALESNPIKNMPAVSEDDFFNVTLRFLEL